MRASTRTLCAGAAVGVVAMCGIVGLAFVMATSPRGCFEPGHSGGAGSCDWSCTQEPGGGGACAWCSDGASLSACAIAESASATQACSAATTCESCLGRTDCHHVKASTSGGLEFAAVVSVLAVSLVVVLAVGFVALHWLYWRAMKQMRDEDEAKAISSFQVTLDPSEEPLLSRSTDDDGSALTGEGVSPLRYRPLVPEDPPPLQGSPTNAAATRAAAEQFVQDTFAEWGYD